jgi:outer membrane protein OmpA-like peptidoglycan-associated protein
MMTMAGHAPRSVAVSENSRRDYTYRFAATSVVNGGGDDGYWWAITLSDLTLLLLGFSLLWYATVKVPDDTPLSPIAQAAQAPKTALAVAPPNPYLHAEAWQTVRDEWAEFVVSTGLQNDLDIESTDSEILLSLREAVPFPSGKADLRARALPVLEKVAATLLVHANLSVAIGGHTDSLRIASAEFPSNWELSTARASRVARYLIAKGIHPARLSVQGYADYQPREPNSTPTNRRTNRRVEIRLFQKIQPSRR